jgi:hypothetical protein
MFGESVAETWRMLFAKGVVVKAKKWKNMGTANKSL